VSCGKIWGQLEGESERTELGACRLGKNEEQRRFASGCGGAKSHGGAEQAIVVSSWSLGETSDIFFFFMNMV
jgi:hypothetical protein